MLRLQLEVLALVGLNLVGEVVVGGLQINHLLLEAPVHVVVNLAGLAPLRIRGALCA